MYCLFLAGRVSFSTRSPVTTANQRTTQTRILNPSFMWRSRPQKTVLILPNGLSKHDRNFNFCRGFDSNPQPLNRQYSVLRRSYHRSQSASVRPSVRPTIHPYASLRPFVCPTVRPSVRLNSFVLLPSSARPSVHAVRPSASVCPSVCVLSFVRVRLSVRPPTIRLAVRPSSFFRLSHHPSVRPFARLFVRSRSSVRVSVRPSIRLFVRVRPSVRPFVGPFLHRSYDAATVYAVRQYVRSLVRSFVHASVCQPRNVRHNRSKHSDGLCVALMTTAQNIQTDFVWR